MSEEFRALHRPGEPLLLPNAWDYGSAAMLAREGFAAIGTTSLGVSAVHGKPDAGGATRAETLALAGAITGLGPMISVDVEGGFCDDPAGVAELVAELAAAGVAGINLEDGRADGTLRPIRLHQEIIEAAKGRGVFVNARTDTCWLDTGDTAERVRAYGHADGIFVPGLSDPRAVAELVELTPLPVNILYRPGGPSLAELGRAGAARVSTGSLLYRASLRGALSALADVRDLPEPDLPSYADITAMLPRPR